MAVDKVSCGLPKGRLPLEPLMMAVGMPGASEFARFVDRSRRWVYRAKATGLTIDQADELAVRAAGLHPMCIWGWDFYADLVAENEEFGMAA